MITTGLCIYLRKSRRCGSGRLHHILDSVTLYTIENGLVTCVVTIISLVFWLAKPHALIYLGLHFVINKLYANCFLASMNARKLLRVQTQSTSSSGHRLPVIITRNLSGRDRNPSKVIQPDHVDLSSTKLQITIDKTVDYAADDLSDSPSHQAASSKNIGRVQAP
ncbi:hypothetical protein AcV5_007320 [Taiwanofungus camphoratus]|nr:hypothetical protein AcV5_007320 [Antrodia cinnamomea]